MEQNLQQKINVSKYISFLKGKHSLKNMTTDQRYEFLKRFNDDSLQDLLHVIEHIFAERDGKMCHLAEF